MKIDHCTPRLYYSVHDRFQGEITHVCFLHVNSDWLYFGSMIRTNTSVIQVPVL